MTAIEGQDDPVRLDFIIRRGYDWRVEMDWTDEFGQEIDSTGLAMQMTFDSSPMAGVFPPALSSATEAITLGAGVIAVTIPKDLTRTFDFVSVKYEMRLTETDGRDRLWAYGRVRLED